MGNSHKKGHKTPAPPVASPLSTNAATSSAVANAKKTSPVHSKFVRDVKRYKSSSVVPGTTTNSLVGRGKVVKEEKIKDLGVPVVNCHLFQLEFGSHKGGELVLEPPRYLSSDNVYGLELKKLVLYEPIKLKKTLHVRWKCNTSVTQLDSDVEAIALYGAKKGGWFVADLPLGNDTASTVASWNERLFYSKVVGGTKYLFSPVYFDNHSTGTEFFSVQVGKHVSHLDFHTDDDEEFDFWPKMLGNVVAAGPTVAYVRPSAAPATEQTDTTFQLSETGSKAYTYTFHPWKVLNTLEFETPVPLHITAGTDLPQVFDVTQFSTNLKYEDSSHTGLLENLYTCYVPPLQRFVNRELSQLPVRQFLTPPSDDLIVMTTLQVFPKMNNRWWEFNMHTLDYAEILIKNYVRLDLNSVGEGSAEKKKKVTEGSTVYEYSKFF